MTLNGSMFNGPMGQQSSEPPVTQLYNGTFAGSATTPGAAGSTTGAADATTVGDPGHLIDVAGATWFRDGNGNLTTTGSTSYPSSLLQVADAGSIRDVAVSFVYTAGQVQGAFPYARRQSNGDAYFLKYGTNDSTFTYSFYGPGGALNSDQALGGIVGGHNFQVRFVVSGATPASLHLEVTDLTTGQAVASTAPVTDSTASLQQAGSCGVSSLSGYVTPLIRQLIVENLAATGPGLSVSPTSATAVDNGNPVSIIPTLSNSTAALTATVTGGGTISTASPTSGAAFTYTPPSTGSGTSTVTVSDATDSLSATCSIGYAPATLAPAPITVLSQGVVGWNLQANVTGGAGGLRYQWQSAASPQGTFANVAGATAQTRSFSVLPGGDPLYVRCVVTDSTGASVTSVYKTAGTVYSGSPAQPFPVVPVADPYQIVLVSDSTGTIGIGFDQAAFTGVLTNALAPALVTVNNQSIAGSTSSDWTADISSVISGLAAGACLFVIDLGLNDAKAGSSQLSASGYTANIQAICSTILGTPKLAGSKVVLMGPGYIVPPTTLGQWDDTAPAALLGYGRAIPALCNGTTILRGMTSDLYYARAINQNQTADGVHETNPAGGTVLAHLYATRVVNALLTPVATAGSTVSPVLGCSFIRGIN